MVAWVSCAFCCAAVSIFVCHDDSEQAYVQRCHHNLDALESGCVFRRHMLASLLSPSRASLRFFDLKVSVFLFANVSCQIQTYLLLEAFIKVTNDLVTFHGEDNVLL